MPITKIVIARRQARSFARNGMVALCDVGGASMAWPIISFLV
jgi:hypothetical protein